MRFLLFALALLLAVAVIIVAAASLHALGLLREYHAGIDQGTDRWRTVLAALRAGHEN